MRNFKKLFAMGTALAMAIIMNVSAFAAAGDSAEDPITGAYDDVNNAVLVSAIKDVLPMTSGQYTVVVIPVLGEEDELTDDNIHYINQADSQDAIWNDNAKWGTPDALEDGVYIVRVGDEAGNVSETYFRVGEEQSAGPKVTFMNGTTTVATVDTVGGKATLPETNPTLLANDGYVATNYEFVEWVTVEVVNSKEVTTSFTADTVVEVDTIVYPKFKAQFTKSGAYFDLKRGDVNLDKNVNTGDRTQVQRFYKTGVGSNTGRVVSEYLDNEMYKLGDINLDKRINTGDRTQVQRFYKTGAGSAGDLYYVINK